MGLRGARQLARSGEFALEHIELKGVERASEQTLLSALRPLTGTNLFELDLAGVERTVRRDPWIL